MSENVIFGSEIGILLVLSFPLMSENVIFGSEIGIPLVFLTNVNWQSASSSRCRFLADSIVVLVVVVVVVVLVVVVCCISLLG